MSTLPKLRKLIREELNRINMMTLRKPIKESHMSNIDLMANEAKNFKDFVKQFYAEYTDFPKDAKTLKWLKDTYNSRSGLDEATNPSF